VRGTDTFHNFEHEERPEADLDAAAVARHQAIMDRQLAILYQGAAQEGKRNAS
jgi:hypothetical protein